MGGCRGHTVGVPGRPPSGSDRPKTAGGITDVGPTHTLVRGTVRDRGVVVPYHTTGRDRGVGEP